MSEDGRWPLTDRDEREVFGRCPGSEARVYAEFRWTAFRWADWMDDVDAALVACCDEESPATVAPPPCADPPTYEEVGRIFREWAMEVTAWARALSSRLCADHAPDGSAIPDAPQSQPDKCRSVCAQIQQYHVKLEVWGKAVADHFNTTCRRAAFNRVGPPPPPPFD